MHAYGLHWFRRDLRVQGNSALIEHCNQFDGRVLGVFFLDSTFLSRPDFSTHRFAFFLKTLKSLREDLNAIGGDLLVLDNPPRRGFELLLRELSFIQKPASISYNRDYEPFARKRDQELATFFESVKIPVINKRDHLLIEPHELKKNDGGFYQVFSPFYRRWLEILTSPDVRARVEKGKKPNFKLKWGEFPKLVAQDCLEQTLKMTLAKCTIEIPDAGGASAQKELKRFSKIIESYPEQRDIPSVLGTSRFSMFLKNGSLTLSQIAAELDLVANRRKYAESFFRQLIWREFYYHILFHCPHVEHESFLPQYKNLNWGNREDWFEAWKNGETGYPIVDAGMRELNQTGWMHNRVRMIVASFLTKDLLIDWRWGEKYFMEKLLDGDLAPNNGGWQWAASTGCDPQPYFRVFNPILQGQKFDPDGVYVRKYLPELEKIPKREVHEPWLVHWKLPIVDHKVQRDLAIKLFKKV